MYETLNANPFNTLAVFMFLKTARLILATIKVFVFELNYVCQYLETMNFNDPGLCISSWNNDYFSRQMREIIIAGTWNALRTHAIGAARGNDITTEMGMNCKLIKEI